MANRQSKKLGQAREAARKGDVDAALAVLRESAAAGDDGAAASLAELLAFLGEWRECIPAAARLLANPFAVHAGNVFDDMVRLLGRAGHETGAWPAVAEAAGEALRQVEARLRANEMGFPEEKVAAERRRLTTILRRLQEYADGRGAPPHELVHVFGRAAADEPPSEAAYRAALAKNKGWPPGRLLDLAQAFGMEQEAVRLYPAVGDGLTFDQAVYVARALAKRGEAERAWEVIRDHHPRWAPVDRAQVAPVVLLTDEYLGPVVTPGRAVQLVRAPRGGRASSLP